MTPREREKLVDQVRRLIDNIYVHRQMKTALYGVDAVALLHGLSTHAAQMSDADLHRALRRIVSQIRDRHTSYKYAAGAVTYALPFTIERGFENDNPVYLVTRSSSVDVPVGSTLMRWSGVPTEWVIREVAEDIGAGNEAARRAMARVYLTRRPGTLFDPPREQELRLDLLLPDGSQREARVQWTPQPPAALPASAIAKGPPYGQGVDSDLLVSSRENFRTFSTIFATATAQPYFNVELKTVTHDGKDYAHLRIFDFSVDDANDFAAHVAKLLGNAPPNGLVIDLRGNPGGYIKAGELLLQLLTDDTIHPHGFRFRASDAINYMIENSDNFAPWATTVAQGCRLGAEHSACFPIEGDEASYNRIGRVYPGPSILIVDALTFSTADMFTAGFKDHAIGPVICTDENIAAGGANNWPYSILRASFPAFLLPAEAEADLDAGVIGANVRSAFSANGHTLSETAQARRVSSDTLGELWQISDTAAVYTVGKRTGLRQALAVYFDGDNRYVGNLPAGVELGFSIRQAIRRKRSDGLVLEDEGITADHYYRMTRDDVLAGNVALLRFACGLLKA